MGLLDKLLNKIVDTDEMNAAPRDEHGHVDSLSLRQKRDLEAVKEQIKNSPNPKFHRSEKEEELSFQFWWKWQDKITPMEEAFEEAYRDAFFIDNPEKQISKYYEALELYHKAKLFCYNKSKGGKIYFQDTWEYLHNSRNACFSYEDRIKESIHEVQELHYKKIPAILKVIKDKNGELLQKNIYDLVPDISRSEVQKILRKLEKDGKILREKSGSTYKLFITK